MSHCYEQQSSRHRAGELSSATRSKKRPMTARLDNSNKMQVKKELQRKLQGMKDSKFYDLRNAMDEGNAQAVIDQIIDDNNNTNEYGLVH